jgi:hypothetical protein
LPPPGAAIATALAINVNHITDLSVFDVTSLSLSYRPLRPRSTTTGEKAEPVNAISATSRPANMGVIPFTASLYRWFVL